MKFASLFLWVLVPLGLWLIVLQWGTPHIALTYSFHDNGDRWNPLAERIYIDCTYVGWNGARQVQAINGGCPWFRFFKAYDGQTG